MSLDQLISEADQFLKNAYDNLADTVKNGVNKLIDELNDYRGWIWGTLQGNWNPNQSTSQIVADAALGLVPVIGQILDLRDLIACIYAFFDEEDDTSATYKWLMLVLIFVGFIPAAGDGIKAMGKIVIANLRKYNGNFIKAVDPIVETLSEFLRDEKVIRIIANTNIEIMLQKISKSLLEIAETLTPNTILRIWEKQNRELFELVDSYSKLMPTDVEAFLRKTSDLSNELYSKAEKHLPEAVDGAQYILKKTAEQLTNTKKTASEVVNINETKRIPTKSHPPKLIKAERKAPKMEPKCFAPSEKLLKKAKAQGNYEKFEKEYYRQLKEQEEGLNSLTAEEYLAGREAYKQYGRGSALDQKELREDYIKKISESLKKTYPKSSKLSPKEALERKKFLRERAQQIIKPLDALHSPDMIAGGKNVTRLGNASINHSIGAQWTRNGRLDAMDQYAKEVIAKQGKDTKMNFRLNRCNHKEKQK